MACKINDLYPTLCVFSIYNSLDKNHVPWKIMRDPIFISDKLNPNRKLGLHAKLFSKVWMTLKNYTDADSSKALFQ